MIHFNFEKQTSIIILATISLFASKNATAGCQHIFNEPTIQIVKKDYIEYAWTMESSEDFLCMRPLVTGYIQNKNKYIEFEYNKEQSIEDDKDIYSKEWDLLLSKKNVGFYHEICTSEQSQNNNQKSISCIITIILNNIKA